ncbi:hypothetical protein QJS10_CPB20g02080 [Acorus calamus]|uniref:Uncharacterized protein n=1 Tax=Acorus calamus TaxID=4465 RepID=A0AAV9CAZ7_ACOCL|nr:hypothetical protein QJS10_CPB20g02080 [Acorus calamus]
MMGCLFILAFLLLLASSRAESSGADSLDAVLRDSALGALARLRRTGVAYRVPVPANLSGLEASVMRVRGGSLRGRGASFEGLTIPPNTTTSTPYAQRLMILHENLRNWSDSYFALPGYAFATPVIGFLAYNASVLDPIHAGKLEIDANGDPISIGFANFESLNPTMRCVRFGVDGSVRFDRVVAGNACLTNRTGHFAIVVPTMNSPSPAPEGARITRRGRRWKVWVVACGVGVGGVVLVGLVGVAVVKVMEYKKMEVGEEGEALGAMWVGRSRMPSAAPMIRTQPLIDDEHAP